MQDRKEESSGEHQALHGTPRDTQPLKNFQIRPALHTALGQSFRWMLTKRTLRCVSQNTSLGIAGRKRAFQTKFAHQQ